MIDYRRILEVNDLFSASNSATASYAASHTLNGLERDIEEWKNTLPPNLLLTPDVAQWHKAMWNTPANTTAWYWAAAHALWLGCTLGLALGRVLADRNKHDYGFSAHPAQDNTSIWPQLSQKHALIMSTLGEERVLRSGIVHALVKPLIAFSAVLPFTEGDNADSIQNAQIREWISCYHLAGLNGMDLADERTANFLRSKFFSSLYPIQSIGLLINVKGYGASSMQGSIDPALYEFSRRPLPSIKSLQLHTEPALRPYMFAGSGSSTSTSRDGNGNGNGSGPSGSNTAAGAAPRGLRGLLWTEQ